MSVEEIPDLARAMSVRALTHDKGTAEAIRISIDAIPDTEILEVPALEPVQQHSESVAESKVLIRRLLHDANIACVDTVLDLAYSVKGLRGAALIDNRTGRRLDANVERGVRASTFDAKAHPSDDCAKNHFLEALVLASKVQSAPGILAEVCLSDDPNYTKGYVACQGKFHRIPNIKSADSDLGTRIFVLESGADVDACIEYLENTPVLIDLAGTEFDSSAADHSCGDAQNRAVPQSSLHTAPHQSYGDAQTVAQSVVARTTAAHVGTKTTVAQPSGDEAAPVEGGKVPRTTSLSDACASRNEAWAAQGLARELKTFGSAQLPRSVVDGKEYLLFASSDYLGLSTNSRLVAAAQDATEYYGTGSGGSRLTTGTSIHTQLEHELAAFFGTEDAVFFATGYQANHSTISALATADVEIFSDSLNHASIIDGCRAAKASVTVFPHGDYAELERLLAQSTAPHALVISDAVFSMSGEVVDLPALSQVCTKHGAWLMLDDAHGIGVTGPSGQGTYEHFRALESNLATNDAHTSQLRAPDIIVGTASKALGVEGGFVLCSKEVGTLLRNQARSYVYSTSSAPSTIAAIRESLRVLKETDVVERLQERIHEVRATLGLNAQSVSAAAASVDAPSTSSQVPNRPVSAIIPLEIGDETQAMEVSAKLREEGIFIPAIRYPTVKRGEAMLRLTITARHSSEDIAIMSAALRKLGIIR